MFGEDLGRSACQGDLQLVDAISLPPGSEVDLATTPLLPLDLGSDKDIACNKAQIFIIKVAHLYEHITATQAGMNI